MQIATSKKAEQSQTESVVKGSIEPSTTDSEGFWEKLAKWGKNTESLAKPALLALGTFYFLGLIVSNEYLAQIGLSDFSLLRIKCILTGVWTVFLLTIGAAPTVFAAFYLFRHGPEITRIENLKFVLYCLGVSIMAVLLTAELVKFLAYWPVGSTIMPKTPDLRAQISNSLLRSACWLVGLNGFVVLLFFPSFRHRNRLTHLVLWCPLYLFLGISLAARLFYPVIGEEMGGGRARKVTLVLNDDGSKFWRQVNEKALYGTAFATTEPLKLLYQNDNTIVIEDSEEHILFIDRKLIAGILPVPIKN